MNDYNDYYSTNEYLVDELKLARQQNEILIENNRRMERQLIECIKDLQECRDYLVEMQQQVGELATVALARVKKM